MPSTTKATRRFVEALGARAFIDHNPRRSGKVKRKKASVERVFSRAKELLNLENLHVRGLKSISIWVYLVFTAMLTVAAAAKRNSLENRIKCICSAFG